MNKKGDSVPIIMICVIIVITIIMIAWYVPMKENQARLKGEVCGEFTSFDGMGYDCCKDCEKLELAYFRYKSSNSLLRASIRNCYCEKDNEVQQIW